MDGSFHSQLAPPVFADSHQLLLSADVDRETAGVHEPPLLGVHAGVDRDVLDGAVLGAESGLVSGEALPTSQPAEDVGNHRWISVESRYRGADVFLP